MLRKSMVLGTALAAALSGGALAAECQLSPLAQAGKTAAAACKGCHELDPGKPSRPVGPSLAKVYGNKAAGVADYKRYSEALKAAGESVTWDEDSLMRYIGDPKGFLAAVNGRELKNGMFFALRDEGKRREITAFMKEVAACD